MVQTILQAVECIGELVTLVAPPLAVVRRARAVAPVAKLFHDIYVAYAGRTFARAAAGVRTYSHPTHRMRTVNDAADAMHNLELLVAAVRGHDARAIVQDLANIACVGACAELLSKAVPEACSNVSS